MNTKTRGRSVSTELNRREGMRLPDYHPPYKEVMNHERGVPGPRGASPARVLACAGDADGTRAALRRALRSSALAAGIIRENHILGKGGESMKEDDVVGLVLIAGAALYVAAHVALAFIRPMLPAVVKVITR